MPTARNATQPILRESDFGPSPHHKPQLNSEIDETGRAAPSARVKCVVVRFASRPRAGIWHRFVRAACWVNLHFVVDAWSCSVRLASLIQTRPADHNTRNQSRAATAHRRPMTRRRPEELRRSRLETGRSSRLDNDVPDCWDTVAPLPPSTEPDACPITPQSCSRLRR